MSKKLRLERVVQGEMDRYLVDFSLSVVRYETFVEIHEIELEGSKESFVPEWEKSNVIDNIIEMFDPDYILEELSKAKWDNYGDN